MFYVIKINTLTLSEFGDTVNTLKGKKKTVIVSFSSGFKFKKGGYSKTHGKISPPPILVHVLQCL